MCSRCCVHELDDLNMEWTFQHIYIFFFGCSNRSVLFDINHVRGARCSFVGWNICLCVGLPFEFEFESMDRQREYTMRVIRNQCGQFDAQANILTFANEMFPQTFLTWPKLTYMNIHGHTQTLACEMKLVIFFFVNECSPFFILSWLQIVRFEFHPRFFL